MNISFYIYLLLGILIPYLVFCDSEDPDNSDNNKAESEGEGESEDDEEMTQEEKAREDNSTINDCIDILDRIINAKRLNRSLPKSQRKYNHHLNQLKKEFSSHLDGQGKSSLNEDLKKIERSVMDELADIAGESSDSEDQNDNAKVKDSASTNVNANNREDSNSNVKGNSNPNINSNSDIGDEPVDMPSIFDDLD